MADFLTETVDEFSADKAISPIVDEKDPQSVNDEVTEVVTSSDGKTIEVKKYQARWQRATKVFNALADISNIGIVITMISKAFPAILVVGGGVFGVAAPILDGCIYLFRGLSESTRVIGKTFFGMNHENNSPFEEEKHGTHVLQTPFQILCVGMYSVAVALMFGAFMASPAGVALGWGLALSALAIATYFNYSRPASLAYDAYEQAKLDPTKSSAEITAAEEYYLQKRKTNMIMVGILFGVAAMMLCGTIALFAPPAIVPVLLIISQCASAYLGLLNAYRIYDQITAKKVEEAPASEETNSLVNVEKPSSNAEVTKALRGANPAYSLLNTEETEVLLDAQASSAPIMHPQAFFTATRPANTAPEAGVQPELSYVP